MSCLVMSMILCSMTNVRQERGPSAYGHGDIRIKDDDLFSVDLSQVM
jgi:hypothetical protein